MANIDTVRLLINDKAKTKFSDDADITAFLTLNNDNVFLAAASALESYVATLSAAESFTIGSYSERANVNALIKLAESYKKRASDMGVAPDGNALAYDDYAEIAANEFSTAEILTNQVLRNDL